MLTRRDVGTVGRSPAGGLNPDLICASCASSKPASTSCAALYVRLLFSTRRHPVGAGRQSRSARPIDGAPFDTPADKCRAPIHPPAPLPEKRTPGQGRVPGRDCRRCRTRGDRSAGLGNHCAPSDRYKPASIFWTAAWSGCAFSDTMGDRLICFRQTVSASHLKQPAFGNITVLRMGIKIGENEGLRTIIPVRLGQVKPGQMGDKTGAFFLLGKRRQQAAVKNGDRLLVCALRLPGSARPVPRPPPR